MNINTLPTNIDSWYFISKHLDPDQAQHEVALGLIWGQTVWHSEPDGNSLKIISKKLILKK